MISTPVRSSYLFPEFFLPPLAMAPLLRCLLLTCRLLLLEPELEPEPLRWRCGCRAARFTLAGCGVGAANSTFERGRFQIRFRFSGQLI